MKPNVALFLCILCLFLSLKAFGSDGENGFFSFSGEARLRFEYDDNFTLKGYSPDKIDRLFLERIRLNFDFNFKEKGHLFIQFQDAHPFLTNFKEKDFKTSSPIKDSLDIRQLYYEVENIGGSILGIKAGRQQISYGDPRLFGPGNWGNTGKYSWDAFMVSLNGKDIKSDLWMGKYLLCRDDIFPDHPVKHFITFVNYNQIKNFPFRLDFFYALKHNTSGKIPGEIKDNGNLTSHSLGFKIECKNSDRADIGATFAFQFGKRSSDNIKAYGFNGKLGYTFNLPLKPKVGLKYTFGSGDSNPKDGCYETFDGIFGGADLYYGFMNLFFWSNIRDVEANFSMHPKENLSISFDFHRFFLASKVDGWYLPSLTPQSWDASGKSGSNLGNEYDLRISAKLKKGFSTITGISMLDPDDYIRNNFKNFKKAYWFYLQITYNFGIGGKK